MSSPYPKNNRPPAPGPRVGQELNGRKILLGVCGGIAAYKAVELARLLMKADARVQVIMTAAATKFVTPLTFETITGRSVFVEMFPAHRDASPWHTELATWPDLAVIAPATANHMARLTAGLADDLLSTTLLTVERPRLLCPSMNHRMWSNPATQENLATLLRRGYRFMLPDEGAMARPGEGDGVGRLVEPDVIFREVARILSAPQDLRGVRILVTAGRTEESWDPVRVLTNRASGRMGFALAEEARERGADVVLIHGPTDVIAPTGVRIRRVTTAAEMSAAVRQEFSDARVVLMSAAVADYTFAAPAQHKIKKGEHEPDVRLVPTQDILKSLAAQKGNRVVVGFALETENLLENALKKLREKHLDIVVANNPLAPGSGFSGETNQVMIIHRSGRVSELPLQSKREAAREILNAVIGIYRNPEPEPDLVDDSEDLEPLEEPDDFPEEMIPAAAVKRDAVAEPTLTPAEAAAHKSKSRRGGRRSAKARARRAAERSASNPPAAASETQAPDLFVTASEPVVVVEEPPKKKAPRRTKRTPAKATAAAAPPVAEQPEPKAKPAKADAESGPKSSTVKRSSRRRKPAKAGADES